MAPQLAYPPAMLAAGNAWAGASSPRAWAWRHATLTGYYLNTAARARSPVQLPSDTPIHTHTLHPTPASGGCDCVAGAAGLPRRPRRARARWTTRGLQRSGVGRALGLVILGRIVEDSRSRESCSNWPFCSLFSILCPCPCVLCSILQFVVRGSLVQPGVVGPGVKFLLNVQSGLDWIPSAI